MNIGPKRLGGDTYIIAEVSINHQGDYETATRLIDVAAEAKVDAVKFQKRHLPSLYPPDMLADPVKYEQAFQYLLPILKKTELADQEHANLKRYAESKGLEYLCTPFDIISAYFLASIGVSAFKIASCDLTNYDLLECIIRFGKPMILSTGMSSWAEIEDAVTLLKEEMAAFALLHCRSAYPVWPREANLKMITKLKQFGVPVGYSGHDIGTTIPLVAASMGAEIIEKHITLDRAMSGPDHKVSLEPGELKVLVRDIRVADQAMAQTDRFLLRGEIINRDVFRYKGIYKKQEAQVLKEPYGKWGMITRPPDFQEVMKFNPKVIEIRFTENDFKYEIPQGEYDSELIIHAPEYLGDKLFDLCSGDNDIRLQSIHFAQKTIDKAVSLREYFKGKPKVILHPGGMSTGPPLKVKVLQERLFDSLLKLEGERVDVLLENLPQNQWYWGGMWKGNIFSDAVEIKEFCTNRIKINICFDLCHAFLHCNSNDKNLYEFIETVKPLIRHIHISDGYGIDGEGVQIGSGDIDFGAVLPLLDLEDTSYVCEIWQGHQNHMAGFIEALNRLKGWME